VVIVQDVALPPLALPGAAVVKVPAGEDTKSWDGLRQIVESLEANRLGRDGTVVALAILHHQDVATLPPVRFYRTANAVALYLVPLCAFALSIALYSDDRRERRAAT